MKHRLLILGTLGEFEQLVQKAREKGYYTIVCDGYPDGPARKFADEAFQIPVTDTERIACLCQEKEIDGIITSFSDLLLECMVKIADRAGIPCYLKPEQLPWYRDKSATRALLTELGLPTPGFRKIPIAYFKDRSKRTQLQELLEGLRYPVVSKPLDKYGSRGIYISEDLEELINGAEKTAGFSDMPEILVEEYNDGYEFNMMTWVRHGKVHVISIAAVKRHLLPKVRSPSAQEMCILPDYCQKLKSLPQNFFRHMRTEPVRKTEPFPCSFSGSREKVSRSARSPHDFSDMSMN